MAPNGVLPSADRRRLPRFGLEGGLPPTLFEEGSPPEKALGNPKSFSDCLDDESPAMNDVEGLLLPLLLLDFLPLLLAAEGWLWCWAKTGGADTTELLVNSVIMV